LERKWGATAKQGGGGGGGYGLLFVRTPFGDQPDFVLTSVETDEEIVDDQIVAAASVAQAQLVQSLAELGHLPENGQFRSTAKDKKTDSDESGLTSTADRTGSSKNPPTVCT